MKIIDRISKKIQSCTRENAYSIAASRCNSIAFDQYKDYLKGKDVVLCGAGPTLNKYKPIPGAVHVAINRAILFDKVHFDFFIADDWKGISFIQKEITDYDCIKFMGHQIGDYSLQIPESFVRENNAKRYYTDSYIVKNGFKSEFVCDINYLPIGNMPNIALSSLQILLFMNPKNIYLVGCDASSNHFTNVGVSEELSKKHKKDSAIAVSIDATISKWHEFKKFSETFYPKVTITSINPVGLKGIFKDEYQSE